MKTARIATLALAALALASGALVARAVARAPRRERPLPPSPAAVEHLRGAVVDVDVRPPDAAEARAALARAFGDAVEPEVETATALDLNGDGSPDLAIAVHAAKGRDPAATGALANWTVGECAGRGAGDGLLAIVHGVGPRGWRDPEARQAYLLRGAPRLLAGADAGAIVHWTGARYACAATKPPPLRAAAPR